jgi:hypothetical protein
MTETTEIIVVLAPIPSPIVNASMALFAQLRLSAFIANSK